VEFNVEKNVEIEWMWRHLLIFVLPSEKKMLLQSLVESHHAELNAFDDFIKGKGTWSRCQPLWPPGVGKTLSAEATSERGICRDFDGVNDY